MSYLDQLISEYEQDGWIAGTQQWCKDMVDEVRVLQSRLESLENEMQEQCRIIGMSAERELSLIAKIESLEKDVARYRWLREDCGIVEYKEAFGSIGAGMLPCGDELDSAIDTAMQANKGD